jgi:hypothetical protein
MNQPRVPARQVGSLEELTLETRLLCAGARPCVVGVDGAMKSGKSTTSRSLAEALPASYLELDAIWDRRLPYISHMDYQRLSACWDQTKANGDCLVVEGLFLREVLAKVGIPVTVHVYVMRTHNGWWSFEFYQLDHPHPERLLEIDQDLVRYHRDLRPQEQADIIFTWNDA